MSDSLRTLGMDPTMERSNPSEADRKRAISNILCRNLPPDEASSLAIEANSVYGAAILIPQVARTASWPVEFISLTISAYVYLALCIAVHLMAIMYMAKSDLVMDGFSGQMYLCDFGADPDACTEGDPGCIGPAGTAMTPDRIYSWAQWATRTFVRDGMAAMFPGHKEEIHKNVDPGEYGLESYRCRLLCVFVFILSVMKELYLIVRMVQLLWYVPNQSESWIYSEHVAEKDIEGDDLVTSKLTEASGVEPNIGSGSQGGEARSFLGCCSCTPRPAREDTTEHVVRDMAVSYPSYPSRSDAQGRPAPLLSVPTGPLPGMLTAERETRYLESVKVRAAGMSVIWKLVNILLVLLPKVILWTMTVDTGTTFLMETSAIDAIIVNSVALGFLLSLDEAIVDCLMTSEANFLVENCEDYVIPVDVKEPRVCCDPEANFALRIIRSVFRSMSHGCFRLCLALAFTGFFVSHYYYKHCNYRHGRFVSNPVYLPKSTAFNVLNAMLPEAFVPEKEAEPCWSMPDMH
eukprot:TRINITY_DN1246_c1_g1_i1.p1 TRINITY_DN1246_c1_g1~~TRINITY_DN1246_c1_g1_i1.p1  ORF type:complete len:519 (+),score=89.98 TRINITY_DN1246_c1_g1_i1:173-1729(+)